VPNTPSQENRASATGRAALEGRAIHIPDVLADPEYRAAGHQQAAGYRTALAVPLLRDETTIGVFGLLRDEMNPFTDKQIALVENFATQAVVAIENARLFNELLQRTTDLTEALEQQTATSEVLQVISSTPGDLEPVFASMLENAVRICNASFGVLPLYEGEQFRVIAMHNAPLAYAELRRRQPEFRTERMMSLASTPFRWLTFWQTSTAIILLMRGRLPS
jgi:two-component system, NtrC family, sensor kinase